MNCKIVFSDVDGTMLDSSHHILPGTLYAIKQLQKKGIPFVMASGRHAASIIKIQEDNGFTGPVAAFSGGLILDEDRNPLFSVQFPLKTAKDIISFVEASGYDCTWNIFTIDNWIVKDRSHPRIIEEERIIGIEAGNETIDSLPQNSSVCKILYMCEPEEIDEVEQALRKNFPEIEFVKSSDTHLEVMAKGISKSGALNELCRIKQIPVSESAAFGDHFNDLDMLEAAGHAFLMGNAPEELKKIISQDVQIIDTNDNEGMYKALLENGLIERM